MFTIDLLNDFLVKRMVLLFFFKKKRMEGKKVMIKERIKKEYKRYIRN
jgi:hypothetical protein